MLNLSEFNKSANEQAYQESFHAKYEVLRGGDVESCLESMGWKNVPVNLKDCHPIFFVCVYRVRPVTVVANELSNFFKHSLTFPFVNLYFVVTYSI